MKVHEVFVNLQEVFMKVREDFAKFSVHSTVVVCASACCDVFRPLYVQANKPLSSPTTSELPRKRKNPPSPPPTPTPPQPVKKECIESSDDPLRTTDVGVAQRRYDTRQKNSATATVENLKQSYIVRKELTSQQTRGKTPPAKGKSPCSKTTTPVAKKASSSTLKRKSPGSKDTTPVAKKASSSTLKSTLKGKSPGSKDTTPITKKASYSTLKGKSPGSKDTTPVAKKASSSTLKSTLKGNSSPVATNVPVAKMTPPIKKPPTPKPAKLAGKSHPVVSRRSTRRKTNTLKTEPLSQESTTCDSQSNTEVQSHDTTTVESQPNNKVQSHDMTIDHSQSNTEVQSHDTTTDHSQSNTEVQSHDTTTVESQPNNKVQSHDTTIDHGQSITEMQSHDTTTDDSQSNTEVQSHDTTTDDSQPNNTVQSHDTTTDHGQSITEVKSHDTTTDDSQSDTEVQSHDTKEQVNAPVIDTPSTLSQPEGYISSRTRHRNQNRSSTKNTVKKGTKIVANSKTDQMSSSKESTDTLVAQDEAIDTKIELNSNDHNAMQDPVDTQLNTVSTAINQKLQQSNNLTNQVDSNAAQAVDAVTMDTVTTDPINMETTVTIDNITMETVTMDTVTMEGVETTTATRKACDTHDELSNENSIAKLLVTPAVVVDQNACETGNTLLHCIACYYRYALPGIYFCEFCEYFSTPR